MAEETDDGPELTLELVSKSTDEQAYFVMLAGEMKLSLHDKINYNDKRTFGEIVDRKLHNIAVSIYRLADEQKITPLEAAEKVIEAVEAVESKPEVERAMVVLHIKAWRHRQQEGPP